MAPPPCSAPPRWKNIYIWRKNRPLPFLIATSTMVDRVQFVTVQLATIRNTGLQQNGGRLDEQTQWHVVVPKARGLVGSPPN